MWFILSDAQTIDQSAGLCLCTDMHICGAFKDPETVGISMCSISFCTLMNICYPPNHPTELITKAFTEFEEVECEQAIMGGRL